MHLKVKLKFLHSCVCQCVCVCVCMCLSKCLLRCHAANGNYVCAHKSVLHLWAAVFVWLAKNLTSLNALAAYTALLTICKIKLHDRTPVFL